MLISNDFYTLTINDKNGSVVSFKNKQNKEFISFDESRDLFSLFLFDENRDKFSISSNIFKNLIIDNNGAFTTLRYQGVGEKDIDVIVKIEHPFDSPFVYFLLNVKNRSGYIIYKIDFPKITVPNDLVGVGGDSWLFTPMMEGALIENVDYRERTYMKHHDVGYPACGWEGVYPGATQIQFMAYYSQNGGLYLAAHDDKFNPKVIEFCKDGDGIKLEFQLFTSGDTSDFTYGYKTVLGVFDGDWYDAAEIYRRFIESTDIIKLPKLQHNNNVPKWLKESPIVVCYPVRGEVDSRFDETAAYYPYTSAEKYIYSLGKKLDSALMPLLMHWEGTAPWAPPYVWPPFGDINDFKKYIEDLHNNGHYLGIYCSGIAWTQDSYLLKNYSRRDDYNKLGIEDIVVKSPKQTIDESIVCGGVGFRHDMCPSCEQTKRIAEEELDKIISNVDVDYVQFFDQVLGGGAFACYAENHNHPFGPGKWQVDAMKDLIKRMTAVLDKHGKRNKVVIGCEADAAEPFVNDFIFNDSRHNINYWFGNPVPAYNYIFHEYVSNFMGNQNTSYGITDFNLYPDNVYFRLAHGFVQGDILTVVLKDKGKIHWDWCTPWNQPEINQEEITEYVKTLNAWRKGAAKASLQFGKMVKPIDFVCGEYTEKFIKGGAHHYKSVESCAYMTQNGKFEQIFVNFTAKEQNFEITLPKKAKLLANPYANDYSIIDSGKNIISIPARKVLLLKID